MTEQTTVDTSAAAIAAVLDIDEDGDIYHLPSGEFGNLVALPACNEKYEVMHPDIFSEMVDRFNGWAAISAQLTAETARANAAETGLKLLTAVKNAHKMRGDNHWEMLRSIHVLAQEGKLEHIIQHVRDAGAGYTKPDSITMWELQDGLAKAIAERDALLAAIEPFNLKVGVLFRQNIDNADDFGIEFTASDKPDRLTWADFLTLRAAIADIKRKPL